MGLIGPMYIFFIESIAVSTTAFGVAFGIMILFQAGASYYAGNISNSIGKKKILFIISFSSSLLLLLYTVVSTVWQLYVLQAFAGSIMGTSDTVQTSVIGDMTTNENRDQEIGKFYAKLGLATAIGFVLGGYAINEFGLKPVFYVSSIAVATSTILLIKIK